MFLPRHDAEPSRRSRVHIGSSPSVAPSPGWPKAVIGPIPGRHVRIRKLQWWLKRRNSGSWISLPPSWRLSSLMTAFIWSTRSSDGTPPKVGNRCIQPTYHDRHGLALLEPQPHPPRVAQHHDQRVPFAPRAAGSGRSPPGAMNRRSRRTPAKSADDPFRNGQTRSTVGLPSDEPLYSLQLEASSDDRKRYDDLGTTSIPSSRSDPEQKENK